VTSIWFTEADGGTASGAKVGEELHPASPSAAVVRKSWRVVFTFQDFGAAGAGAAMYSFRPD
jgi:hypothetical protein